MKDFNDNKEKLKTVEVLIPKGQTPEEYLDMDDSMDGETPDSIEEVKLVYAD